jgi:hypothetical protein
VSAVTPGFEEAMERGAAYWIGKAIYAAALFNRHGVQWTRGRVGAVREAVARAGIAGDVSAYSEEGRIRVSIVDDATITFDALASLSEQLGTRLINIECEAAIPDYSEYTPGNPASCAIVVRWP